MDSERYFPINKQINKIITRRNKNFSVVLILNITRINISNIAASPSVYNTIPIA